MLLPLYLTSPIFVSPSIFFLPFAPSLIEETKKRKTGRGNKEQEKKRKKKRKESKESENENEGKGWKKGGW